MTTLAIHNRMFDAVVYGDFRTVGTADMRAIHRILGKHGEPVDYARAWRKGKCDVSGEKDATVFDCQFYA